MTQLGDLVAPEFEANRLGHAERVDVEDSATHRELGDVVDHGDALEADRLEMCGEFGRAFRVALPQLQARLA